MNKIKRVLVNGIFLGLTGALAGCSSSGGGDAPSNSDVEDLEDAIANILGTNTPEGMDVSDVDGGGENPGEVPTVIAELTTLDVSTADALRGHKVFAGDEIRSVLPGLGLQDLVQYTFFNLEFPCSGEGEYEAFPAPQFTDFTTPIFGTFTWGANAGSGNLGINNQGITAGDEEVEFDDELPVTTIVDGSLIVGTAVLEMLVVDRIVQFEICQ